MTGSASTPRHLQLLSADRALLFGRSRDQPIDRAIQRFRHGTLGDSIGMAQGDDQRPQPQVPTATSTLAGMVACVSAAWPKYQATWRRPPTSRSGPGPRRSGSTAWWGLTARTIPSDGSLAACNASSGAGSSLPLMPGTVTAVPGTGSYR